MKKIPNSKNKKKTKKMSKSGKVFEKTLSELFNRNSELKNYLKPNVRFHNTDIFGSDILLLFHKKIIPLQLKYRTGLFREKNNNNSEEDFYFYSPSSLREGNFEITSPNSIISFCKRIYKANEEQYGHIEHYHIIVYTADKKLNNCALWIYTECETEKDRTVSKDIFNEIFLLLKVYPEVFTKNKLTPPVCVYYIEVEKDKGGGENKKPNVLYMPLIN